MGSFWGNCALSLLIFAYANVDWCAQYNSLPITNALLIFLDDDEAERLEIGSVTSKFATAVVEEAGPILVSASLVANIYQREALEEKDPRKILARLRELRRNWSEDNADQIAKEEKAIKIAAIGFNAESAQRWIIKEINPYLYLFLPKHYLRKRGLSEKSVREYRPDDGITDVEYTVGLKVNHMQTVSADDIRKPSAFPEYADYFMDALWNKVEVRSPLFVTRTEDGTNYWGIYINGHGSCGKCVTNLLIPQFKDFLDFLENKLFTKLLYYQTCYGTGMTSAALYKDAQKGIEKTYSFAIITQSLTEAVTGIKRLEACIKDETLKVKCTIDYAGFVEKIRSSDVINYRDLIAYIVKDWDLGLASFPQIKFPGLPWFSVVDQDKVISIGWVMARTRKRPLDIATFGKKREEGEEPLGILLYTDDVPFELVINSDDSDWSPDIISMIPGKARHHLAKISSQSTGIGTLLNSFLQIESLAPEKIFIIDSITGLVSEDLEATFGEGSLAQMEVITFTSVVINLTRKRNRIYFSYEGKIYKIKGLFSEDNSAHVVGEKGQKKYQDLLLGDGLERTSSIKSSGPGDMIDRRSLHKQVTEETIADLESKIAREFFNMKADIEKGVKAFE